MIGDLVGEKLYQKYLWRNKMNVIAVIAIYLFGIITGYLIAWRSIARTINFLTERFAARLEVALRDQSQYFNKDDRNIQ
jgi:hypothetical protein